MSCSPTCSKFSKHLHRVIKSLLAKQIKSVQILDVVYLMLLITIRIILHLLTGQKKKTKVCTATLQHACFTAEKVSDSEKNILFEVL